MSRQWRVVFQFHMWEAQACDVGSGFWYTEQRTESLEQAIRYVYDRTGMPVSVPLVVSW